MSSSARHLSAKTASNGFASGSTYHRDRDRDRHRTRTRPESRGGASDVGDREREYLAEPRDNTRGRTSRQSAYDRGSEYGDTRVESRNSVRRETINGNGAQHRESRRHVAREREEEFEEPSFIAETSFVHAPLNSRVSQATYTEAKGKGKARENGEDGGMARVPLDVQEAMILEDLLYVLMGIDGTYLSTSSDGVVYGLDPSLQDLVQRILPLGMYYTTITTFIEQRSHSSFGLVNHALCAAIRDMLKDYQTLLSQLEHAFNYSSSFSLQKMWFYVHPTVHTMALIYQLVTELSEEEEEEEEDDDDDEDDEVEKRNQALGIGTAKLKSIIAAQSAHTSTRQIPIKGGEVLSILAARTQNMSGDPTAHALYTSLFKAASRPYARMLRTWMSTGTLSDPHDEIMVKEARFINRGILEMDYTDEYWERRYTLRDVTAVPRQSGRMPGGSAIPLLLEGWKHKILLAGKYLNVIRECGMEIMPVAGGDVDMDDQRFYTFIQDAYTHANRTLLTLLLKDQMLIPRLRSLRRYFFLSHSSFLTHFLDLAHSELRKSAKSASIVKLQSLLELSLNGGEEDAGNFKEDLKVTMARDGLYDWLMKVVGENGQLGGIVDEQPDASHVTKRDDKKPLIAIDALALDYSVKFPLSLVLSRKTILRYQLLFRFLMHLKHVEQSLGSMWLEHMTATWRVSNTPPTPAPASSPSISRPPSSAAHRPPSSATARPPSSAGTRPPSAAAPPQDEFTLWRLRIFSLRTRMLAFVQHLLAFASFQVLEPNWRNLEAKLSKLDASGAGTVDQLLRDHVDFLDTCLKECMLTSSKLLRAFSRLIVTCSTFAVYTAMFTKAASGAGAADATAKAKRWDVFLKFETNFNHWFKVYLDCVQYYASSDNVSLLPLVVRLNSIQGTAAAPQGGANNDRHD
ncbi:hypothetical protein CYLTODRAFT_384578 [Cylindrobasidium torrendii FP15055 ss-10]|uniref:Spindle pole body component n=1 Tax=Cylindrobasidium torrendii FP15055 ss-10 TaxID=1314674 RepID=A0A0D7AT25_9AGAR|nr:hypothetical protein CYLTODRAFT_384578 [Cylindrobasidium torrendii FP15055 ss-10]